MADRNTHMKDAEMVSVPVAASAVIDAGKIVAANASGYGTKGAIATTLTYLGRSEGSVDNTSGADGAKSILVRRGKAFKWSNSSGDPVDQTCLGKTCYIEDDQTVSKTDGTGTQSAAGIVVQYESDGIWVQ